MARQRITRKELLRQPDQFLTRSARIIEWAEANASSIFYGIGAVILVGALVGGWFAWQANRHHRAEALLYEALNTGDTGEDALQNTPQPDPMVEGLQDLVRDYDGTSAAAQAYWHLGRLYFERADYVAAVEAYEQARQRLSGNNQSVLMHALISLNMAYAEEAQGACARALENFQAVLQAPTATWLRGEAYLGMGRCHEQSDAPEMAAEIYNRALSDAEINELTRQVLEERLAIIESVL